MKLNVLDRLIAWLSPLRGARRLMARTRMETARAFYDGATVGRRGASIRRSAADANVITRSTLPKLRNGAHDLVRNNPHAARAVDAIVANTVGTGIMPQFLRGDGRAEDIEALARQFLDTKACDAEGRHNYAGLQALAFRTVVESGEVLIRRRRRRAADGLPVPFQYQVLEPDFLDESRDFPTRSGGRVIQGVEFDAIGRVRGYWLFREHPGSDRLSLQSEFVPARDILHIYREDRPGQVRGIPWLATVMLRLADFMDFEDARLVREKIAACFVAFRTEAFDGLPPAGTEENDQGQIIDKLEPGIVERLRPGESIEFGSPPQVEGYEEYVRASLRAIAVGMGISYTALTGDLTGVNFSSGKMGHIEFQRNIARWQWLLLIPQMCGPMMEWFIEGAALAGAGVDGVSVRHIPPRREMIDPTKEVPAERAEIRAGLKTLYEAIRQRGRDPVEHLKEIADTFRLLDELDLRLDSDPRQPGRPGAEIGRPPGAGNRISNDWWVYT